MLLKEFAGGRKESAHTIATYIRRHPDVFDGHTGKEGNQLTLDDVAVGILEKVYPLPSPVEVIKDVESLEKLVKLQEYVIGLHQEKAALQEQLMLAKADLLAIETDLQGQIEKAVKTASEASEKAVKQEYEDILANVQMEHDTELKRLQIELETAQAALAKEKSKTWWDKLLRR